MNDSYLDLSVLIDSTPGPNPEVRDRLSTRLQMLIESEQVGARQRHRGWQRTPWTHRAGVIAVAAAIVVVFFVPLPHASLFHNLVTPAKVTAPMKLPAVDLSATPPGWVPVADGEAQLSVPATWWVLYNVVACPTGSPPGEILVNPYIAYGCPPGMAGQGPRTVVTVSRSYAGSRPSSSDKRRVINGFTVYDDLGTYFVPSLGLHVSLSGPLAQRVLHTLSRSPRTIALATGPAPSVPASWHQVTFAGLRFSVPLGHWQTRRGVTLPADWVVYQTSETLGLGAICQTPGVAFSSTTVTLSTDAHRLPILYCPVIPPTPPPPENGVQVDSGLKTEPMITLAISKHCLELHGLTACPATSPAYSILVLKVTVPGRNKPVYVSIGLAGNGMIARTILYSLRASPAIGHPLQVAGTIAGTLVRVGGPSPGAPVALPGQVTARSSAGRRFTVTVGKSGKFVLSVSAGEYKLTGHSPLVSQETCMATKPVRVKTGQRVSGVEVICSIS